MEKIYINIYIFCKKRSLWKRRFQTDTCLYFFLYMLKVIDYQVHLSMHDKYFYKVIYYISKTDFRLQHLTAKKVEQRLRTKLRKLCLI